MDLSAMPTETREYIGKVTKRMGGSAPRGNMHPPSTSELVAEREVAAIRRADTIADPRLRADAINRVQFLAANDRKLIQERERAAEVNKAEFKNNYNNVIAKLGDGVDVPVVERPTQEQLVAMYGAEGDRMYREMNTYATAAPAISQLKTATVQEAGAILATSASNCPVISATACTGNSLRCEYGTPSRSCSAIITSVKACPRLAMFAAATCWSSGVLAPISSAWPCTTPAYCSDTALELASRNWAGSALRAFCCSANAPTMPS